MKAPLRSFDYLNWMRALPRSARFDLSRSGMADTAALGREHDVPADPVVAKPLGTPALCLRDEAQQALSKFTAVVAGRYGVDTTHVSATVGAGLAITQVLLALVRPGDHVIVERPTYEPLHRIPEVLGARVSRIERNVDDAWTVAPERLARLLESRTKAVILSNLHNPSGLAIDIERMRTIAELAARVGARVLVDEVYLDYCFSDKPEIIRPACRIAPNAISWSSSSKAFGFSALRAGWIVTEDADAHRAIQAAADYLHGTPPVATLVLATRMLEHADRLTGVAATMSHSARRVLERWLAGEPRVAGVAPPAGLIACIRLPDGACDFSFSRHLRERYDTQVVPGSLFEARGHVRVGLGLVPLDLEQALANFSATLDDLC